MGLKRGVVLFVLILILLMASVLASNGCCAVKDTGATCVYTAEEDCTTPEYFLDGEYCEESTFCEVGCCVKPDGLCAENTGKYSCDDLEGAVWTAGLCEEVSACKEFCCQYESLTSYNTEAYCENLYGGYGGDIIYSEVSESECTDLARAEVEGCCVHESACGYFTYDTCVEEYGVGELDVSTGYGFYEGQTCSEVSDNLESGSYDASSVCSCEVETYVCDGLDVVEKDSCDNLGAVEKSCSYPSYVCYDGDGEDARCISTTCAAEDTFSFPEDSVFEQFNSYRVYYTDAEDVDDYVTLDLGDSNTNNAQDRKSGEVWCIYESPTGDFSDRVGSRHYEAFCVNGIEMINPCSTEDENGNNLNERGGVCTVRYDSGSGMFEGGCEDNNYEDYYTEELYGDGSSDNVYYDRYQEPVESESVEDDFGVSTVPFAGTDSCDQGTIDCTLWYADRNEGSENKGWELYGNSICLKDDFALTAADYCGSRGDCGLNLNVLGNAGGESGLAISASQYDVGNAYVGHGEPTETGSNGIVFNILKDPYRLNDGEFQGVNTYYDDDVQDDDASASCFDTAYSHEGGERGGAYDYDYYYNSIFQGLDFNLYPRIVDFPDNYGDSCNYYTTGSIVDYYLSELGNLETLNDNFARDYMINKWFSLEFLIIYSTSFLPSDDEGSSGGVCQSSDQRFRKLNWGMGFNVPSNEGDYGSEMGLALKEYPSDVSDDLEDQYGELYIDFYNAFRSYKPWVMNKQSLDTTVNTAADETSGMPDRALTFYVGEIGGCNFGTEFSKANEGKQDVVQHFTCGEWEAPSGGEDCNLCDELVSEGGLVFEKDGVVYPGSYCSEVRCNSLGSTCEFVAENREVAIYDKTRPSCVDGGGCDPAEIPEVFANVSVLDEQGLSYEISFDSDYPEKEEGVVISDLMPVQPYDFGFEVEPYSMCKVMKEEDMPTEWLTTLLGYDDFDPTYTFTASTYFEFSGTVDETNSDHKYYVVCRKAACELDLMPKYYQVTFESGDGVDDTAYGIETTYPLSGTEVAYAQEEVNLKLYLNEYATCKYSTTNQLDIENMEHSFSSCDTVDTGFSSDFGKPICEETIELESGTTYLYILCEDLAGNVMVDSLEWYVTKTGALEISQTAPSGDLYYDDITLQVKTANGGAAGVSTCSFKEEGDSYYQVMENTPTIDHDQTQSNLAEGDYIYYILCEDEIGNTVEETIEFSVLVDREASEVDAIYYLSGTLYVLTNEISKCQYNTESFTYGYGEDMSQSTDGSTDHSLSISDLDETYYIACIDKYGNEMSEVRIDLSYYV
jgi:hypothetical protein